MTLPLRNWALAALATAALAPLSAQAQTDINSTYISISGLYVSPTDSDLTTKSQGYTLSTDVEMDSGFGLLVAVGRGADLGLRGEVEFGYRQLDFDKIKGARLSGPGIDVSVSGELPYKGDVNSLSLMGNAIYTFEAGRVRPYFGMGLGLARHDATEDAQTATIGGVEYSVPKTSDDDIVIAYQGMLGISLLLGEGTETRLGYRYFATGDADFDGIEASYGTHNFEGGIVFRF